MIKLVLQQKDDQVIVKIKDNGAGFNKKDKGSYFSPDWRLPSTSVEKRKLGLFGGYGMGVGIIVEEFGKIGGKVQFKNRKDKGAAIYISFPAKSACQACTIL